MNADTKFSYLFVPPIRHNSLWGRLWGMVDGTAVAAFLLPFLLYLFTLAPTIYNLDSAELTTAAATGGILRATGYPLYLAIGRVWAWLPIGDMGYRFNLLSAFCAALTILQAENILRRIGSHRLPIPLSVGPWARVSALGLLATAPYFWSMSLIAEVYTLHTALLAGIILALLRWSDAPSPSRLALPVFLMALSLGNHAATVLLIPGGLWYVLTTHPRLLWQPRYIWAATMGLLAGLLVFLYLPWRFAAQPAFNYAGNFDATGVFVPVDLQTWPGFLWLITGRSFAGQMFGYTAGEVMGEWGAYGVQLWRAFFIVGIGPGMLGLAVLARRNWRLAGMLLLIFAANAIFYVNYRVVDKNTMFLPTYLVWALWLGVGYQTVLDWLPSGRGETAVRMLVSGIGRGIIAGAVLLALVWNWPLVDLSHDHSTRQQSSEILQLVEPNAIIFGWWETVPGIQYLQLVEGQRPDVLVINRFLISGSDMTHLIQTQIEQRPIYINNPPLELIQSFNITKVGPLYRLEP